MKVINMVEWDLRSEWFEYNDWNDVYLIRVDLLVLTITLATIYHIYIRWIVASHDYGWSNRNVVVILLSSLTQ